MDCPSCAQEMTAQVIGGSDVYYCPGCGWGRDRALRLRIEAEGGAPSSRSVPAKTLLKLPLLWALSAAVVLGPYYALLYGVPAGVEALVPINKPADPEKMRDLLNPGYWISFGIYLLFALAFSPKADTEDLGWAAGLIDNPFTWEDDRNRHQLVLSLLLAPGKLVLFTVTGTFRVLVRLIIGR